MKTEENHQKKSKFFLPVSVRMAIRLGWKITDVTKVESTAERNCLITLSKDGNNCKFLNSQQYFRDIYPQEAKRFGITK